MHAGTPSQGDRSLELRSSDTPKARTSAVNASTYPSKSQLTSRDSYSTSPQLFQAPSSSASNGHDVPPSWRPQPVHLSSFVHPLSSSVNLAPGVLAPTIAPVAGEVRPGGQTGTRLTEYLAPPGSVGSAGDAVDAVVPVPPEALSSRSVVQVPWEDDGLRDDVLCLIDGFLAEMGYGATRQTLAEEWHGKARERSEASTDAKKLRKAILEGAWDEVDKLLSRPLVANMSVLRYSCYKQQYLELIEAREYQKAFTHLNKRLRALEHFQPHRNEFVDLCYLLSGKSVSDAPSFKAVWEGVQAGREGVVVQFAALLDGDHGVRRSGVEQGLEREFVPPGRLRQLLGQAAAYQVASARYHPKKAPRISSLLYDYEAATLPNTVLHRMIANHVGGAYRPGTFRRRGAVKSAAFVGLEGRSVVTGSLDGTLALFNAATGGQEALLEQRGRVWDVDSSVDGNLIAAAGGEASVSLWSVADRKRRLTLHSGHGDLYSCVFDPSDPAGGRVMSGGYDKLVWLWDVRTGALLKTFTGHSLGVTSISIDPSGRLATTASKDCTVRLWDLTSGLCVGVLRNHLGEVTSAEIKQSGKHSSRWLLSASKDNSSLLTDLRTMKPVQRFKGAQNTRANFIRSSFLHNSFLATGDESGAVVVHEADASAGEQGSAPLQRLSGGHAVGGLCYGAKWSSRQGLLVSCGDEGAVSWVWRGEAAAGVGGADNVP